MGSIKVEEWNKINNEEHMLRRCAWYRDSEETVTLIGTAHDRGIWLCRAGMLMESKRLKISRGVFGDEEDYHLVRGEEGGGQREMT